MLIQASDSFDLNEKLYALLNCKNGIIASILRDFRGIDINPYFADCYIPFRNIVKPIQSGDIAGINFGNTENELWQKLFSVCFDLIDLVQDSQEWHKKVIDYLKLSGPLLVPHNGFYDKNAADKYQLNHILHNSLIYGVEEEGIYHIGDRHIRNTIDFDSLYQAVASTQSKLLGVHQASEFTGDWNDLLNKSIAKIREGQTKHADITLVNLCIDAIVKDAGAEDGNGVRWKQAHSYIKAVGASREMTANFLNRYMSLAGESAELAQLAENMAQIAQPWHICSALTYKYMITKDDSVLANLKMKMIETLEKELNDETVYRNTLEQMEIA